MGCLHSKKEPLDVNPNLFRVVNIDEHGADLCSGLLEITDTNIVLHREGRESTVWPLHSLRRYGFEGEVFSFESGRRCETGPGIYAFKCRRASTLFRALQTQIQLRDVAHDSTSYPISRTNPSPQGRQTLQANVVHRSSIDNGQPDSLRLLNNGNISTNGPIVGVERNTNQIVRSSSSADILEVLPLYPLPHTSLNHARNVYQVRDFKREHNNNQGDLGTNPVHLYSNDFNRDLAMLRNKLKREWGQFQIRDEEESFFMESCTTSKIPKNEKKSPLSPTLSSTSEHYAHLCLKQKEPDRYYININENEKVMQHNDGNKTAPPIPPKPFGRRKQVEYCNLSLGPKQEPIYANILLGEAEDGVKSGQHALSVDHNQKFSEADTFTSTLLVEELEVNYAVLDIDANKEILKTQREIVSPPSQSYSSPKKDNSNSHTSQKRSCLASQSSIENINTSNENIPTAKCGYTTIDFDKTVALTSVAADADVDADCPRKTRHNSCNMVCGSPTNGEKHK